MTLKQHAVFMGLELNFLHSACSQSKWAPFSRAAAYLKASTSRRAQEAQGIGISMVDHRNLFYDIARCRWEIAHTPQFITDEA